MLLRHVMKYVLFPVCSDHSCTFSSELLILSSATFTIPRLLIGVLSGREAVRLLYCCCYCGSMQLSAIGAFCHVFLCYLFYAHTCFSASLALIWFALSCLLFFMRLSCSFCYFCVLSLKYVCCCDICICR